MIAKQSAEFIGITKQVTKQELDATISIRPTMGEDFIDAGLSQGAFLEKFREYR